MGRFDDWPPPPPPSQGWRPMGVREQIGWITAMVVGVAVVTDVLIAVTIWYRPWGGGGDWIRRVLPCTAIPLNLVAIGSILLWLALRKRERRR